MAANSITGLNQVFPIYNQDGTPFNDMVLYKASVDSVVMSLGDKITGDAYYRDNALNVTMQEYITYDGVKYVLVNPPTIVREGLVQNNSELKGMTKYSFEFYHPMYQLSNIPFCDVAVSTDQQRYLSESKTFSWIGKPQDLINKLNKNLEGTQWIVVKSSVFPQDKENKLSDVISFDKNMISDVLKTFYDTWGVPYIIDVVSSSEAYYAQGKRFKVVCGYPSNEIYANETDRQSSIPYIFRMGQGVGLKNNSRTPRNNKIITRISGYGSEDNIPYGYPQIVWNGDEDDPRLQYPLYDGIVGGRYVKLIKHPFTRTHLMPSVYSDAVNKKVNPNATGYNPNIELKDYYDAVGNDYPNQTNPLAPSYEIHEFEDVKPEMDDGTSNVEILGATPLNADLTPANVWVDDIDDDGNFVQSYFLITLPQLSFDIYACAAITQEMQINMRSGACIGCTFPIQVDWDDYKRNFYDENGGFAPDGEQRDLTKYPKSNLGSINVIVQKENSTFGTVMPNIYQQPQSGDKFVILGISLPEEYITLAEQKLDSKMREYLLKNNVYYFDYPLKFDEYFLATHQYILSQLKPNSIVRFDFAGTELSLYVKQLTKKFGNSPLPEYDITLTDNIEVVLNQIGQTVEVVSNLSGEFDFMQKNIQTIQGDVEKESKRKNINRFYYYAQEWEDDDEIVYVVNQLQAPYFSYQGEYWIFNPAKIGTYSMHEMGEPTESINNILGWEKMNAEFKYIITKVIFSENAYLGSFIINGDWMISQHGTVNGSASTDYTAFDPDHPNDNTGSNFIPNFAVDGETGQVYIRGAYIEGNVYATGTLRVVNSGGYGVVKINGENNAATTAETNVTILDASGLYSRGSEDGFKLVHNSSGVEFQRYHPATSSWQPFYAGRAIRVESRSKGLSAKSLYATDDFVLFSSSDGWWELPTGVQNGKVLSLRNINGGTNTVKPAIGQRIRDFDGWHLPTDTGREINNDERAELVFYNNDWYLNMIGT